jgi:ADP-ribosyltransferase exoenzyme
MEEKRALLLEHEIDAIAYYTEDDDRCASIQRPLRKQAADGTPLPKKDEDGEDIEAMVKSIKSGLAKLPCFESDSSLWRGCGPDVEQYFELQPGKVFCDPGFLSTSQDERGAQGFIDCRSGGKEGILFEITQWKSGKDIAFLSGCDGEMEVLFPPSTEFVITKREGNKVWMKELDARDILLDNSWEEEEDECGASTWNSDPSSHFGQFMKAIFGKDPCDEEDEDEELFSHDDAEGEPNFAMPEPTQEPTPEPKPEPESTPEPEPESTLEPEPEPDLPVMEQESFVIASPIYIEDKFQPAETVKATVEDDGFGTLYVSGRRRSARHQEVTGSVFRNGRRQSARLLNQ